MSTDLLTVDCRLALNDSPVGRQPEYIRCPFHTDDRPSLAIYPDGCYCHVCHNKLRRMETLAYLLYGSYEGMALKKAFAVSHKYTSQSIDAYRERVDESTKNDPLPKGLASAYHSLLYGDRTPRRQWLYDRGLGDYSILVHSLGHDGTRFTIPVFDASKNLLTIRFRRDDYYGTTTFDPRTGEETEIPRYSGIRGRNGLFLYPLDALHSDWVVVTEGELDALRLIQEGIPAISATNGAGNVEKVPALLQRHAPWVKRLFIATDQDDAGRAASHRTSVAARLELYPVTQLRWPIEWGKDVTELYQHGHTLEEAGFHGDDDRFPPQ